MIIDLPMTGQSRLPRDDRDLPDEEVEGFLSSSDKRKGDRRQKSPSGPMICLLCLLSSIALFLAFIAAMLWSHHHHIRTIVDNTHQQQQQGKPVVESSSNVSSEAPITTGNDVSDALPAAGQAEDITASYEHTGTPAYDAWVKDSSLPAPFTVWSENLPGPGVMNKYTQNWGTWQLGELPKMDRNAFCGDTSHCDIPRDKFPKDAWQSDTAFVGKFLDEADKLVDRARNAILAEYGKSPQQSEMFDLTYKELNRRKLARPPPIVNGGWTTKRSMDGLARRLLHAIMTRDTFTFVLGGHSAAAGHGNHFKQSYAMQFHKVMEPVFSYLGVPLISRNLAQGGLGTVQSALGSADIYGDEIDFLVWDSGMTEGRDGRAVDMYGRQALLAHRVPVLWHLNQNLLELYHEHCDADVGQFGEASVGIPISENETHVETLPYALQYMECDKEHGQMCKENKYHANCWVDRPDVTPPATQKEKPGSQVSWHPGFRSHQLTGRILAYTVLTGLKEAITLWKNTEGNVLPDDAWHVTAYYDNIRTKVKNLDPSLGACVSGYNDTIPTRICKTKLRARTEFTPRANPESTSLRSILKTGDYVPSVEGELLYSGPDVRNPMFDVPQGQVDVLAILNNGRKFDDGPTTRRQLVAEEAPTERSLVSDKIVPGKGYQLDHPVGYCDGTYNAVCKRTADNECLLYGHHDGRGGLRFHEFSGWIVMDVPNVKEGIIMIKMETWHFADEVTIAEGWTTVNNEVDQHRRLKRQQIPFCDDFHFDFAIDGKITSWNLEEFQEANKNIQRVVEVFTLLDDPTYTKGEGKNVEVAIRMHGCGDQKVFSLTHVYWA